MPSTVSGIPAFGEIYILPPHIFDNDAIAGSIISGPMAQLSPRANTGIPAITAATAEISEPVKRVYVFSTVKETRIGVSVFFLLFASLHAFTAAFNCKISCAVSILYKSTSTHSACCKYCS